MEDDEDLAMLPASNSATRAGSSGGDSQPLDSRGRVHSLHTELERHAQAPSSPRHRVGNLPHNRYNLLPDFKGGDGDDMDEHGDWHSLNSDFLLCDAAPECHFRFPLDRHTPTPARSEAGPFGRGGQGRLRRAAVLQQCALLVRDALVGCASFFRDDQESIVKYKRYRSWPMQLLLNTGAAIIMLLAFFERPNGSLGLLLPTYVTMPVEVACLLLFLMRLHQLRSISTESTFWRDRKNVLLLFCIAATFMDMVATVCTLALGLPNVRWSRVLRPVIMCTCCDFKEIRRGFRGIRKTLSSVFYVVVLLWMVIALFALLLLRLLDHKNLPSPRMAPYFTEWAQAFWDLYILMTSANFPNIMMPAYQSNRWYSLVFIVFIILSMYVFLSITLATVYNNYRENIKNEIKNNLQIRRINLKRVFELIAVDGFVYFEQWSALLAETHPQYGLDIVEIFWNILDVKEMDKLDCSDFLHVADVLNLHVQRITSIRNMLSVWFPRLYFSAASILLQQAVRHRLFTIFFDLLITANAVTIALALNLADVYFLVIFNIEILLMIYTFSFMACAKSLTTAFDACVVITATISAIIDATQGISDSHRNFVNFILVLRVLCFIKVIRNIKRFRLIFDTLASLGPAVVPTAGAPNMFLSSVLVYY
jgi:two pore calcium channel protein 3